MSTLLYVECSPRKASSKSTTVAKAFLEAYRQKNPEDTIQTLDLWSVSLPEFDGDMLEAKYAVMSGQGQTEAQIKAWGTVADMAASFAEADKYLFAVPMWNFSIPYRLKHFFDIIIQPGLTFSFSPEAGYTGLIRGKKAVLIYSRGGAYAAGSGSEDYDLQTKTLGALLGFIGITDQHNLLIEPTLSGPDDLAALMDKASQAARKLAAGI